MLVAVLDPLPPQRHVRDRAVERHGTGEDEPPGPFRQPDVRLAWGGSHQEVLPYRANARTRARAHRLGVFFVRTRDFTLPERITVNGKSHPVALPDEQGVRVAFLEVLLGDCYGIRAVGSPQTILDVGANVGLFSLAARIAHPAAIIHAYEPNRQLERYLHVQAAVARCDYFLEALALQDGHVVLELHEDSVRTRSRQTEGGDVPAVSLRRAVARLGGQVDFAKVDCEGAEWELFQDADAWTFIRQVAMEYHVSEGRSHAGACDALERLGYTVTRHDPAAPHFGMIHAHR